MTWKLTRLGGGGGSRAGLGRGRSGHGGVGRGGLSRGGLGRGGGGLGGSRRRGGGAAGRTGALVLKLLAVVEVGLVAGRENLEGVGVGGEILGRPDKGAVGGLGCCRVRRKHTKTQWWLR